jgi:anaerobic selenocysteine-containing dehydrogenase
MIVVDVRETRTASIADYFMQVEPNKDYELFQALRALLREEDLQVESVAGVPVDVLEDLVDVLVACEFGVLFFGVGLTMSASPTFLTSSKPSSTFLEVLAHDFQLNWFVHIHAKLGIGTDKYLRGDV